MKSVLDFMRTISSTLTALLLLAVSQVWADGEPAVTGEVGDGSPARIICWLADGQGIHPTGELEGFLIDRLGATGNRVAIAPDAAHAILRILGLTDLNVFDPGAAHRVAEAGNAAWVVWVKAVSRDVQSRKGLSLPYLVSRRRLDANVFYDIRVYEAATRSVIGSKRLTISDRGETTWQILEDERLDPTYANDAVELHQRMRNLDWRAAAAISGYMAGLLEPETVVAQESP